MSLDPANDHLDAAALERFFRGDAAPAESRRIVPHLLSGCSRCLRLTRELWGDPSNLASPVRGADGEVPVVHPASYSEIWGRMAGVRRHLEQQVEEDRRRAGLLLQELEGLPPRERLPQLCGDQRFASFHLFQRLVAASLERGREDPRDAEDLAEMAVAGVEGLDRRVFGEAALFDLKASAWCALGTARRRRGELEGAERAFGVAEAALRLGSGDPLERAELLLHEAALRRQQCRFRQALSLLRRARQVHARLGDEGFLGRLFLEQGRVEAKAGDPAKAAESLRQSLEHLGPKSQPDLVLEVVLELGHLLLDAGKPWQATRVLPRARRLASVEATPRRRCELARLSGRLEVVQQRRDAAETLLTEARRGFLDAGLGHEAALATLDLAVLFARQGSLQQLRRLGEEMTPVLLAEGTGVDGVAALLLLREAAETQRATPGLVANLAAHLRRVRPAAG